MSHKTDEIILVSKCTCPLISTFPLSPSWYSIYLSLIIFAISSYLDTAFSTTCHSIYLWLSISLICQWSVCGVRDVSLV